MIITDTIPKIRVSLTTLAVALAAAGAAPLLAQEQASESDDADLTSPVIVVTGEGLEDPLSSVAYDTRYIEREQLVSAASGRIEDALSGIAGFQQFRRSDSRSANPSAQGATLRALGGNATSRALVLLDGVPMADPFFGYIPFSAIAPERLSYAKVTRGGGSGPFGAGALAGTIELVSADAGTLGTASGRVLSNNRGETEAAATLAGNLGRGFATISGRWDRGKGFFTTPTDQRVPATARAEYDSWSVQLRGVAPVSDTVELQARGLVYEDNRTLRFAGADNSMEGQDASLRLVGTGDWQFDLLGYVQARNFTNAVVSSTRFVPVLDQRNTPATGLGGKLELRPPSGDAHELRLGVDYRVADGELFETAISAFSGNVTERRNAGGRNSNLGLFIEDDYSIGPVVLTAGARADRYSISGGFYTAVDGNGSTLRDETFDDRSGWIGSFRGGAMVGLANGMRLRVAGYTGLRLPTLNELYRPFVVFPVTTLANEDLKPERLEGFEIGLDYSRGDRLDLGLTLFDNTVRDAIANVTLDATTRQRRNIDSIRARGVEASAALAFGDLRVNSSLAYVDAETREEGQAFNGNRPSQSPSWIGSATASWSFAERGLAALTLRHVGKQFEDDLESDALPAATTVDAYVEFPVTRAFAVVLRGENLTDETIVTRNQGGSVDLGVPRTLWAGLKVGL